MSAVPAPLEVAWFAALCDDDYEFLGVPDPSLASSFEHCGDIVRTVDRLGFDNVLLPSGYSLGIDATEAVRGLDARRAVALDTLMPFGLRACKRRVIALPTRPRFPRCPPRPSSRACSS